MTASIASSSTRIHGRAPARFIGLAPLIRKDIGEWAHGKRAWVVLIATSLFMALSAANAAIATWVIAHAPAGATLPKAISMDPVSNVMHAVGAQIFVVAAVMAAMSLLITEREHGTLAWVASKPVSRGAIWTSKAVSASAVLGLVAGVLPLVAVAGLAAVLYGPIPMGFAVSASVAIVGSIVFAVVLVLAASTVVSNQAAAAAIAIAVYFVPSMVAGLLPFDVTPYLPSSFLGWAVGFGLGADVGFVTPIAWALSIVGLAALAIARMERLEL